MSEASHAQNPVLRSLASRRLLVPVLIGEVAVAMAIGLAFGLGLGLGPIAFFAVGTMALGAMVLARRSDHDRNDYALAAWRVRFGKQTYDALAPDTRFRPMSKMPAGLRLGLERRPGFLMERSTRSRTSSALSEQVPLWDILTDEEGQALWVTPTGSVVIGYELRGLHVVYADSSTVLAAARRLYFGAAQLPDEWEAQIILHSAPPAPEAFASYSDLRRDAGAISREQADVRVRYLHAKRPRRFQLRLYVSRRREGGAPFRGTPDPTDALKAAAAAESWLSAAGLGLRRLTATQMWADAARWLASEPAQVGAPPAVVDDESPRQALIEAAVTWRPEFVRIGGRYAKVLTLSKLQGQTLFTDIETLFLQGLDFDFSVVTYVRTPDRVRTRATLNVASRIAYASAMGARVPSGLAQSRFDELRSALDIDQAGEQRIMHFGLQVAVWGRTLQEVQERAEQLQRRLTQHNYTLIEEAGRHDRQYLTAMMPGGIAAFDRWITLLSNNVVDLMPLFDSRSGDAVPACLFETDRGELWAYNPADARRINWNTFVVGSSGSGKSVMVNSLIANASFACRASRGRVLVVDFAGADKSSYLMLARVYGGRFIPVLSQDGVGLNPFPPRQQCVDASGTLDGHTESFLTVLIDLLTENQERGKDTKLYRNRTQEALRALYSGSEPPCFKSFLKTLARLEERAPDPRRATLLRLLVGTLEGPGGALFMSEDRLVADEPFVIFDLFGIESYAPEMREAIVFVVCDAVRRLAFSKLENEETKKYIFLDEVAQLVRQPGVVSLIQELYATARKHGTSVCTVTQKYSDFVGSGLAETVRSNSTTGIFLSHASDEASRQRIAEDLSFTAREAHLFQTLVVRKGEYSEFLLRTDDGADGSTTAKLRLGLPPFEYELYTSDVSDRRRQAQIRAHYPDETPLEILRRAARRTVVHGSEIR